MAFRITTNGMFRAFQSTLTTSNTKLQDSMSKVANHRAFESYAEDPAAASKAFQLRRNLWRTEDQITNSNYLIAKFQTGYSAVSAIVDGTVETPGLDGIASSLQALSDTNAAARKALGQELISKSQSVALDMNVRYSDEYVFAGTDALNPPFVWEGDKLLFRGIDVNAPEGTTEYSMLQEMAQEKSFVDIGLGMQEDLEGNVIESSAFNGAVSGAEFLGYGLDEDGDPKNLAVLMQRLGEKLMNTTDEGYFESGEGVEALRLGEKLVKAVFYAQEQHVKLSASSSYLQTNLTQLNDSKFTLNEEIDDLEQKDPANAIMEMYWAQYCYQASLRIGNDLLSQTLFDYMS